MANCAKVILSAGRLTKDPQQKTWQGTTVVSFPVAVNTTKKEGDNYISDFYNVSVWGKAGEFLLPRLKKGSFVDVVGDLIQQTYTDQNTNEKRTTMSVRASDVHPLDFIQKFAEKKEEDESGDPPPF